MVTRGETVSNDEVAVRYVSPRYVDNDLVDGSAFHLRERDRGELSVNLIGADESAHEARLETVRSVARVALRKNGRFAQIRARSISHAFTDIPYLADLALIHDPLAAEGDLAEDPTHAVILNLPLPGSEYVNLAGDLLAEKVSKVHPAL